jgi:outer membrane protein assembly factor BamA
MTDKPRDPKLCSRHFLSKLFKGPLFVAVKLTFLTTLILNASCSMTKGLKEGQQLHFKTNLQYANPEKVDKKGKVEFDLSTIAKPTPATGLAKLQVGWYNALNKNGKEKGFGAWLQRKFGKAPVIYDNSLVESSRQAMEKYMQDHGYFGATISLDTTVSKRKVTVNYTITSKGQYIIREIHQPADTLPLTSLMAGHQKETLIETGQPYDLLSLTAERARLASLANNNGYFEVDKDNFYFFVDTTAGDRQVDIFLRLKQTGDSSTYRIYYMGESFVYPDYSLENDMDSLQFDTIRYSDLTIVQQEKILRPSVMSRLVWQNDPQRFNLRYQNFAVSRLLNLGIFKFVNLRFDKRQEQDTLFLDRQLYLTPGLMRDVSVEFQVNSRSGNFLGSEVGLNFTHKNLFKGAELFSTSLTTGFETNINADGSNFINTLNISGKTSLELPGIYAPFIKRKEVRGEVLPRTVFSIGDDYQQRPGFFTVNSFNFSAGYNWQRRRLQHSLNPLFVNLVNVLETSGKLDSLLQQNRRLRTSFENVLILGLNYAFSLTNQTSNPGSNYFFYRAGFESAGALLNAVAQAGGQARPKEVFGTPFSQYLKIDNDFRYYIPLRKALIASRFNVGFGYPYGNSSVLPYIKQYFIGGASSLRAFRIRTLGPGGYETIQDDEGSNFVDQTGDMKLELNLEYRFPIVGVLKGAFFIDAGNIWLVKGDADERSPQAEGRFDFSTFYREIAIGTGLGLRVDFEVAAIRLDWAFPIRKPSITAGNRWLFSSINPLNGSWRQENLVWNLAIGYPF